MEIMSSHDWRLERTRTLLKLDKSLMLKQMRAPSGHLGMP